MSGYGAELVRRFGSWVGSAEAVPTELPFIRQVLGRRTVRNFSEQPPSENVLDLLCATALSASSKSDFQQASILRLANPAKRAEIGKLFPAMPWIGTAPAFFVFLGDASRLEQIGAARGKPVANGNLEGFFNAAVDAALVLQTFILAAESAGLGCCPISVIRNRISAIAEILDLPDKVFPVAGLCVGVPAQTGHLSLRLPRTVSVHRDTYSRESIVAPIDDYDRRRHERHAIPKQQHRAPEIHGEVELYGWSEDKARQAMNPEGAEFPVYLRKHGFTFD